MIICASFVPVGVNAILAATGGLTAALDSFLGIILWWKWSDFLYKHQHNDAIFSDNSDNPTTIECHWK